MPEKAERRDVVDYLIARYSDAEALCDWYALHGLPSPENLDRSDNSARQALQIVLLCQRLGPAALRALANAIRETEGQAELQGRALLALERLSERAEPITAVALEQRLRAWLVRWRWPLSGAAALAVVWIAWSGWRQLAIERELAPCGAAAGTEQGAERCLALIFDRAAKDRALAAQGLLRLSLRRPLSDADRGPYFALAKLLAPGLTLPSSERRPGVRAQFEKLPTPDALPEARDAILVLEHSDPKLARELGTRLAGKTSVVSAPQSLNLDARLTPRWDLASVASRLTGARAVVGRASGDWSAFVRADGVEQLLQLRMPRFDGAQTLALEPLYAYLSAGFSLNDAYAEARAGRLNQAAQLLVRSAKACGQSCGLAAIIDVCFELVALAAGDSRSAESALKRLETSEEPRRAEAYALGSLAWQLARPISSSGDPPLAPWFNAESEKRLLESLDEETRRRLEPLAHAAETVSSLRLHGLVQVGDRLVAKVGDPDTSNNSKPRPRKLLHFEADSVPSQVPEALKSLHAAGWKEAELLLASAYTTVAPRQEASAPLRQTLELMRKGEQRHVAPVVSLLLFPAMFMREDQVLSADEWERALTDVVPELGEITRRELGTPTPGRIAQRLGMWLSMSQLLLRDEKLLHTFLDTFALSALADDEWSQADFIELLLAGITFFPAVRQFVSTEDLWQLIDWLKHFQEQHGATYPVFSAVADVVLAGVELFQQHAESAHDRLARALEVLHRAGPDNSKRTFWISIAGRYLDAVALVKDQRPDEAVQALQELKQQLDALIDQLDQPREELAQYHLFNTAVHRIAEVAVDVATQRVTRRTGAERALALVEETLEQSRAETLLSHVVHAVLGGFALVVGQECGASKTPGLQRLAQRTTAELEHLIAAISSGPHGAEVGGFLRAAVSTVQVLSAGPMLADNDGRLDPLIDAAAQLTRAVAPTSLHKKYDNDAERVEDLQLFVANVALEALRESRAGGLDLQQTASRIRKRVASGIQQSLVDRKMDKGLLATELRLARGLLHAREGELAAARASLMEARSSDLPDLNPAVELLRTQFELDTAGDSESALKVASDAIAAHPKWAAPITVARARAHAIRGELEQAQLDLREAQRMLATNGSLGRVEVELSFVTTLPLTSDAAEQLWSTAMTKSNTTTFVYDQFASPLDKTAFSFHTQLELKGSSGSALHDEASNVTATPSEYAPDMIAAVLGIADAAYALARSAEPQADATLSDALDRAERALARYRMFPEVASDISVPLVLWTAALSDLHGHTELARDLYVLADGARDGESTKVARLFESSPWLLQKVDGFAAVRPLLSAVAEYRFTRPEQGLRRSLLLDRIRAMRVESSLIPAWSVPLWLSGVEGQAPTSELQRRVVAAQDASAAALFESARYGSGAHVTGSAAGVAASLHSAGYRSEVARVLNQAALSGDESVDALILDYADKLPQPRRLTPAIASLAQRRASKQDNGMMLALGRKLTGRPDSGAELGWVGLRAYLLGGLRGGAYAELEEPLERALRSEQRPLERFYLKAILHAVGTLLGKPETEQRIPQGAPPHVDDYRAKLTSAYLLACTGDPQHRREQAAAFLDRVAAGIEAEFRSRRRADTAPTRAELEGLVDAWRRAGDRPRENWARIELANLDLENSQLDAAIDGYDSVLRSSDDAELREKLLKKLIELAPKSPSRAERVEAYFHQLQAYYVERGQGEGDESVACLLNWGKYEASQNQLPQAQHHFQDALSLARYSKKALELTSEILTAYVATVPNAERAAWLQRFIATEADNKELNHVFLRSHALRHLAVTFADAGDLSSAEQAARAGLQLDLEAKLDAPAATDLKNLLKVWQARSTPLDTQFLELQLQRARAQKTPAMEAVALRELVSFADAHGDKKRLMSALLELRTVSARQQQSAEVAASYVFLSRRHFASNEPQLARDEIVYTLDEVGDDDKLLEEVTSQFVNGADKSYVRLLVDEYQQYASAPPHWRNQKPKVQIQRLAAMILTQLGERAEAVKVLRLAAAGARALDDDALRHRIDVELVAALLPATSCEAAPSECRDALQYVRDMRKGCEDGDRYECAYWAATKEVIILSQLGETEAELRAAAAHYEQHQSQPSALALYAEALLTARQFGALVELDSRAPVTSADACYGLVVHGLAWSAAVLASTDPEPYARALLSADEHCQNQMKWSFREMFTVLDASVTSKSSSRVHAVLDAIGLPTASRQAALKAGLQI